MGGYWVTYYIRILILKNDCNERKNVLKIIVLSVKKSFTNDCNEHKTLETVTQVSGYGVVRWLHARWKNSSKKVIIMSAKTVQNYCNESETSGLSNE